MSERNRDRGYAESDGFASDASDDSDVQVVEVSIEILYMNHKHMGQI